MKEHQILFSGAMVRALLDGRKTQTRRVVTPHPPAECGIHYMLGTESWLSPEDRKPTASFMGSVARAIVREPPIRSPTRLTLGTVTIRAAR